MSGHFPKRKTLTSPRPLQVKSKEPMGSSATNGRARWFWGTRKGKGTGLAGIPQNFRNMSRKFRIY
jgi:hypothetical protein